MKFDEAVFYAAVQLILAAAEHDGEAAAGGVAEFGGHAGGVGLYFRDGVEAGRDDWKKVVGMFDGDEMMKRIDEHGAAIRRAERRKARRG